MNLLFSIFTCWICYSFRGQNTDNKSSRRKVVFADYRLVHSIDENKKLFIFKRSECSLIANALFVEVSMSILVSMLNVLKQSRVFYTDQSSTPHAENIVTNVTITNHWHTDWPSPAFSSVTSKFIEIDNPDVTSVYLSAKTSYWASWELHSRNMIIIWIIALHT